MASGEARVRLEALYREHAEAVYGYARTRLAPVDAEDVTADVFRNVAELLTADPARTFNRSWLLTAVQHRVIDRWRREVRWNDRMQVFAADMSSPAEESDGSDLGMLDALDRLSYEHRSVLVLRYVHELSAREVADLLERSPTAVDSLVARARRQLELAYAEVAR